MKEIWKDIPGYDGLYQVSTLGRVRSVSHETYWIDKNGHKRAYIKKGRMLKINVDNRGKGYQRVRLHQTKIDVNCSPCVHRLVAITFIPNPEKKPQVNHIDGDTRNNNVNNLEWATSSENNLHKFKVLGQHIHNEKNVLCTETGERFCSTAEAGRQKGINCMHIAGCCRGDYGRHTAGGYHWRYVN